MFPQTGLNGSQNQWIVKPGAASCGYGIEVLRDFDDICSYVKTAKSNIVV